MRSGPWFLSLCVALGATQGAWADDANPNPFQSREPVTRPKLYYFSKSGNDAEAAPNAEAKPGTKMGVARLGPAPKNYYKELFEQADRQDALKQQAARSETAPPQADRATQEQPRSTPASPASVRY